MIYLTQGASLAWEYGKWPLAGAIAGGTIGFVAYTVKKREVSPESIDVAIGWAIVGTGATLLVQYVPKVASVAFATLRYLVSGLYQHAQTLGFPGGLLLAGFIVANAANPRSSNRGFALMALAIGLLIGRQ